MYGLSADVYDTLYSFKDYEEESRKISRLIAQHKRSGGRRLLDVACGTGSHLALLESDFECSGVEPSAEMRRKAKEKLPFVEVHEGDMKSFDLDSQFDVVLCLFSAIGYMKDLDELRSAAQNMMNHLVPGGVLIAEPWLSPEVYRDGKVHANFVDEPDLKIARMVKGEKQGRLSIMEMHHLVADPSGVRHFVERHEMGLFTREEYMGAFSDDGFETSWEEDGLMADRGLVIVVREEVPAREKERKHKKGPQVQGNQGAFEFE